MSRDIEKKTIINPETGEIIKETFNMVYDGFSDEGFRYRYKSASKIEIHLDSIPPDLDKDAIYLLLMISEMATTENVLVKKIPVKKRFENMEYEAMKLDEIRLGCKNPFGRNKFTRYWTILRKQCIKRVWYHDILVFAINPAILNKTYYVPFWLYEEFQDYMNPHLTNYKIKKLQSKIDYSD